MDKLNHTVNLKISLLHSQLSRSKIYDNSQVKILKCRVKIASKYLNKPNIKSHNLERIEEALRLRDLGFGNKQIAEILNRRGWRKWMGNPTYNRSDIGIMVLKWKKRQNLNTYQLQIGEWEIEEN